MGGGGGKSGDRDGNSLLALELEGAEDGVPHLGKSV